MMPREAAEPISSRTRTGSRFLGRVLFAVLLVTTILLPVVFLGASAFAGRWPFPRILPEVFSLRAFRLIGADRAAVARALGTSTLYALAVSLLSAALCLLPAQFLARTSFRGQGLLEAALLSPALLPAITFSMGVQVMFIRLGLADSFLGVVLVLTLVSYPYVLRALKTGYLAYRTQYDECARNLGAGRMQRVLQVELPMILPSALSGASVAFLVAFSEYFLVFLIGGGRVVSFTGYLVPAITGSDRVSASALTLLFTVVPLALFLVQELFLQWYYVRKGVEPK